MRPLLRSIRWAGSMLYLFVLCQHAKRPAVAAGGHLFLLAYGCLVAQCCVLGDWIQSSRSDHAIPAIRTASPRQQLACQPSSTATTSGMPWPATACEPRSILRRALHPSSLCTCKLACQTAANDVAGGPQRSIVSSPCSSLLRTTTPVPAFVLP